MAVVTIGDTVCLKSNQNTGIIKSIGRIKGKIGTHYEIEFTKPGGEDKCYFKRDAFKLFQKNNNVLRVTVGDIVKITKIKCKGIIRFIGNTLFKPDIIWYGIQLEQPNGKNNGCIDGVQYFQCPNNYGLFVKSNRIETTKKPVKKQRKQTIQSTIKQLQKPKKFIVQISKPQHCKQHSKLQAKKYPITRCFDRIKLFLSGYQNTYYIPDEIKQIIVKYYFRNNYVWIEISKDAKKYTAGKNSWIRSETKSLFPSQAQFQFDEKCPVDECVKKCPLTFIASYKRPKPMKYFVVDTIVEINEYHCFECNHYIRHNLLSYVHKGSTFWNMQTGVRLNRWYSLCIKPAPCKLINSVTFLEKNGECYECKKDTLLMNIYKRKNVEFRVRYCDECHLMHRDRYRNPDVDDSPYSDGNNWGLPKGWVVQKSRSQNARLYFLDPETGRTQWKDPRPLPYGFKSCISSKKNKGRIYYVSKYLKKSTWKDPRPRIRV